MSRVTVLTRRFNALRPVVRRRVRDDRGAAATLVAVLLAGGVLLGMTALVVDVGQLYTEREELVSGADAAANAVAFDCALDRPECDDADTTAGTYADLNAADGVSDLVQACGDDPEGRLDPCQSAPSGKLTDCIGDRPVGGPSYVEVRVRTELPDGSTLLPSTFAQTLVGGPDGHEVGACARVAWGAPAGGLAMTLSHCEWNEATNHGDHFAPPPPEVPDGDDETVIYIKDSPEASTCPAGPSGWDAPGGFGYLDEDLGECMTEVVDDEYGGAPGVGAPSTGCPDVLADAREDQTVLLVPVFDGVDEQGQNTTYHLAGFAAFVVTGYHLSPGNGQGSITAPSTLTGKHHCDGSERCLYGYFTEALVDWSGPIGDAPSMGALVVRTIG